MPIDIKTTILHYKKLPERKQNMLDQMAKFQFLDYSFYEDYDKDELTYDDIKKYYVSGVQDPKTWESKLLSCYSKYINMHNPQCNLAEISLTIKFGKVFQKLSTLDFDMFILFEDDVILCDNFDNLFHSYMKQTPDDWDAIYFGSGANLKPLDINSNQIAYLKSHPASRCADSIVLRKKTVQDLASTWFPFNLISDWELGYQHYAHNHKVYWWEPSLVLQGSEHGMFGSTLR